MSHISESIPDLLGGVSQLAPQRRSVNEVESMVNCQLRPAEGVVKRPPTTFIAEIAASASTFTGAFVHAINKNATERFWVIVLDGDLKIFNATTGVEVPITFPDGKTYLDVVNTPNESFRLATFNDTTVIVNREITVARAAELSTSRGFEAMIVVQQSDFAVNYSVAIGFLPSAPGSSFVNGGSSHYRTPNAAPENQSELGTDRIAFRMIAGGTTQGAGPGLDDIWGANGTQALTFKNENGNIVIGEGVNFPVGLEVHIFVWDDLANQGLVLIHKSVKSVDLLPTNAPVGFRIKVEGDPGKSLDDVFFEYTDAQTWREGTDSNIPIALDTSTLPLEVVFNPNFVSDVLAETPGATFTEDDITDHTSVLLQTADGAASTLAQAIVTAAPAANTDRFMNLAEGNGASAVLKIPVKIDETQVVPAGFFVSPTIGYYAGDVHSLEVAMDTGSGFVLVRSIPLGRNLGSARQVELQYDLSGVTAGADIRIRLVSAAGNRGAITLTYDLTPSFELRDALRVTVSSPNYAPNTVLAFTLNGTAFTDTFVAGGTQAAYLTNLKTVIEAYGGTAVTATINTAESAVIVTNDDGTVPTIASFVFTDALDLTKDLFNGSVDFVALGAIVGDSLKNLTDTSVGTITAVTTKVITCSAGFSGGVANVWTKNDKADVKRGTEAFICREPTWGKRTVGTEETNKWPSFDDGTINEVAFLKNRLVLLSDENVTMSEVDEFFNFFRSSTVDVLDSDRIDVALAGNKASALHSAFTWNETLLTWSELGQFVVNGEPFLSPNTVRREGTTAYLNTRKVKPVTSERAVYFLTEGKEFTQLWDYKPTSEDAMSAAGNRLSVQVPRFMPGTPRGLLAVSDPETVLVLTATDPEKLYIFSHLVQDQERVMGAWHEWTFTGVTQILGMGSIDNEVSLILERDDGKVHLEVIDLWELSEATVDSQTTNGDPASPPVFNPTPLQTHTEDTFTEASNSKVSDHTASPTSAGAWLVPAAFDFAGTDPSYSIDAASDKVRALNVVAASADPIRVDFADPFLAAGGSDIEIWSDFSWSGNQGVRGQVLVHLLASKEDGESGLRLTIQDVSSTNVSIKLDSSDSAGSTNSSEPPTSDEVGGIITISTSRSHAGGAITSEARYGIRVVGDIVTVFTADAITGANETTLYTGTLLSAWKTKYRGGTYSYHGLRPNATLFQTVFMDNFHYASGSSTIGTSYTTVLGDSTAFPIVIGVEADGTETVMTNNDDGTVTFPTDDTTSITLQIGLPVASTIVLSKLYHRKNFGPQAGQAEVRGNTYINNLMLALQDTTTMQIAVAITGHASFSQDLTEVRSLDGEYMHCQVGGRNEETTLTLTSSDASNFKIVGFDWEGVYYNRTRRMS